MKSFSALCMLLCLFYLRQSYMHYIINIKNEFLQKTKKYQKQNNDLETKWHNPRLISCGIIQLMIATYFVKYKIIQMSEITETAAVSVSRSKKESANLKFYLTVVSSMQCPYPSGSV